MFCDTKNYIFEISVSLPGVMHTLCQMTRSCSPWWTNHKEEICMYQRGSGNRDHPRPHRTVHMDTSTSAANLFPTKRKHYFGSEGNTKGNTQSVFQVGASKCEILAAFSRIRKESAKLRCHAVARNGNVFVTTVRFWCRHELPNDTSVQTLHLVQTQTKLAKWCGGNMWPIWVRHQDPETFSITLFGQDEYFAPLCHLHNYTVVYTKTREPGFAE